MTLLDYLQYEKKYIFFDVCIKVIPSKHFMGYSVMNGESQLLDAPSLMKPLSN